MISKGLGNENKSTMKYHLIPIINAIIKRQKANSGKDVEKGVLSYIVGM